MRLKIILSKAMAVAAALCAYAQSHAGEAPYPTKNVTIVVPFAAGGSADILTRGVARGLTEMWGRSIVSTINAAVNKVLTSPEMKQLLDREGAAAAPMSVAQLADLLPKEIALYRKMAQAAGMKPE